MPYSGNVLIVEDSVREWMNLEEQLNAISDWVSVSWEQHLFWSKTKLNEILKLWEKVVIVLDGSFPKNEAEYQNHHFWRKYITSTWKDFLTYMFSILPSDFRILILANSILPETNQDIYSYIEETWPQSILCKEVWKLESEYQDTIKARVEEFLWFE